MTEESYLLEFTGMDLRLGRLRTVEEMGPGIIKELRIADLEIPKSRMTFKGRF